MPRIGTAHRYKLAKPVEPTDDRTSAQMAVLWFLRVREMEGNGGVTQAELNEFARMSPRTVGTAVRALVKAKLIR